MCYREFQTNSPLKQQALQNAPGVLKRIQQLTNRHRSAQLHIDLRHQLYRVVRHGNRFLRIIRNRPAVREASEGENDGVRMHRRIIPIAQDLCEFKRIDASTGDGRCESTTVDRNDRGDAALDHFYEGFIAIGVANLLFVEKLHYREL